MNFAIVGSGPNGASPHHEAGPRRIGPGEVVVCDFGGEYDNGTDVGYCSDITRTVVTGEPDSTVSRLLRRAPRRPSRRRWPAFGPGWRPRRSTPWPVA